MTTTCSSQVDVDNFTRNSCISHLSFNNDDIHCCELRVPCDCCQRLQPDSPPQASCNFSRFVECLVSCPEFLVLRSAFSPFLRLFWQAVVGSGPVSQFCCYVDPVRYGFEEHFQSVAVIVPFPSALLFYFGGLGILGRLDPGCASFSTTSRQFMPSRNASVHSQARRFFPSLNDVYATITEIIGKRTSFCGCGEVCALAECVPLLPTPRRALKRLDTLTPSSSCHYCWRQTLPLRRSVVQIGWLRRLERHENRRFLFEKSVFLRSATVSPCRIRPAPMMFSFTNQV